MKKPKPKLGPLQQRAENLLRDLKKNPTRGNVTVAIQGAVADVLKAIAEAMCHDCEFNERGHKQDRADGLDEDDEPCAAREMKDAWELVRPKLWGNLA